MLVGEPEDGTDLVGGAGERDTDGRTGSQMGGLVAPVRLDFRGFGDEAQVRPCGAQLVEEGADL
jgi:hypothetical protein